MKRFLMPAMLVMAAGGLCAGTNTWTSLGPDGGPVYSLAVDPRDSTIYAMTPAGVFRSTDGTASWSATGPGPVEVFFFKAWWRLILRLAGVRRRP